jgi:hypothetical protein
MGAEVSVDALHFSPIGETVSMELAQELYADRRPIDDRPPPNMSQHWSLTLLTPKDLEFAFRGIG